MAKYCGSEDVYKELVEDSEENWLYGLLSFAVVEEQRIEWMKHYEEQTGRAPEPTEVQGWYEQQPASVLLRAKGTAESALQAYSADVLDIALENQRKDVEQNMIVSEVRELRSFWPQFGVNLAGGLASALLFAALLTVIAFFVLNNTSPAEIGRALRNEIEVLDHGKE